LFDPLGPRVEERPHPVAARNLRAGHG
jgi:hypothetical protein